MKLLSARQAWRDALHESRDSVLAAAAERARLGKRGHVAGETLSSLRDSNGRCAHMLAAGLVQQAIGTLPRPLQHFGHSLYSPVATGRDLNIAHALVWFTVELPECTPRRREAAYWMALAAIRSHQALMQEQHAWGPGRVCEFVEQWYGLQVSASHWARDWATIWSAIATAVDQLDARALKPVADVIARLDGRRIDHCRWSLHDREQAADARSIAYLSRRDGVCKARRKRLESMDGHAFEQWCLRMKGYAKAYRREWGEDVLIHPIRHQIYLDRVNEYWYQRQRIAAVKTPGA